MRCPPRSLLLAPGPLLAGCATQPQDAPSPAEDLVAPNRPTFSDGTSLVPLGRVQLETGYTYTSRSEGGVDTARQNAPEVVLRYRPLEGLEGRLIWGGYSWTEQSGTSDVDGGTDPSFAFLVPVAEQDGLLPTLVFEGAVTFGIGSEEVSSGHADPTFKVLWSYGGGALPDWFGIGGNLNASWPTEDGDRFTQTAASLWTTFATGPDTSLFAEGYVVALSANNGDETCSVNAGIVHRLSPSIAVDARFGLGLDDDADDWFTGFGFSVLF